MKIKYLLNIVIGFFLTVNIIYAAGTKPDSIPMLNGIATRDSSRDTVWITGGIANPGNFEAVINGDTVIPGVGHGTRNSPNTVYVLAANTLYIQQAGLNVKDSAGTLTIIGLPTGGKNQRPVILHNENNGAPVTSSEINASFTIKNIQYESEDLQGNFSSNTEGDFILSGSNLTLDIENSLFEFDNISLINGQSCPQGLKVYFRGNYFRNFFNGSQWWGGRVLYAKVPIDTFVFTNNTATLTGLMSFQQNSLTRWAFIDHNTIIDDIKYPFINPFYLTCFFTNNLIVNSNLAGDDSINFIKDELYGPPDSRRGVIGIDSINTRLVTAIQDTFKISGTSTFDTSLVGPGHIKFYAACNYLVNDSNYVFYNYWHGINPIDGTGDSAYSYLTLAVSKPGPYGLINYPETFINSRGVNLANNDKKIVISSVHVNAVDTMPTQALNMKTSCLDTSQVNFWIQWNRAAYEVPIKAGSDTTVQAPPFSGRITFGDADPTTIPGPGGAEYPYTSATGGIIAFTDLMENFYQTVAISSLDSLPVGSFIWGTNTYNEGLERDLDEYAWDVESGAGTGVNEAKAASAVNVSIFPNPFSSTTTFKVTLPVPTHVNLTIYNLADNVITTLINGNMPDGIQLIEYAPAGLTSGLYIYVLTTNEGVAKGKIILLGK